MEKAKSERILEELCQRIGGDWLLVGGTLIQLRYDGERATEDIDLVQLAHPAKSREVLQHELFRFLQGSLGMGPEHVNLAVEFFVQQLEGWQTDLSVLREGPEGRVFEPSLTLLVALKARRGSELDWNDIRTAVRKRGTAAVNEEKLARWLPKEKLSPVLELLKECGT